VTPYYSRLLSPASTTLVGSDGVRYSALTPPSETRNYGIEVDNTVAFGNGFRIRSALTWQRANILSFFTWTQPQGNGPIDNAVLTNSFAGNEAAGVPEVMANITPSYSNGPFLAQLQWQYVAERQVNAPNAFALPAYDHTNLTLQWHFTDNLQLTFITNNLFNQKGVVEWVPGGNYQTGLFATRNYTKERVAADPNQIFNVLPIQARSYFAKVSYAF
jgi:outer membrane receptor for ferrienterochelin and colicin